MTINNLNIVIDTWIDLREDFILPLRIDIADVDDFESNTIYNKFNKIKDDLYVDIRKNPFEEELLYEKFKLDIQYFFRFINTKSILYKEGTLLQHINTDDLFEYFCNIGFTDNDFVLLKSSIMNYVFQVKNIFITRAHELLKVNINPKQRKSKFNINYNNYDITQTETFMQLQTVIEYHNSTPIFRENIGRSYDKYSWREVQIRLMFLHRKNQIDSELKAIENDLMPTNKTDKR